MKRIWAFLALAILLAGVIPTALAQGPVGDTPAPQAGGDMTTTAPEAGIESLSGSFVVFDSSVGGDTCFIPGNTHTFCFRAESFTNDYEYVYNLWQRFPADWTVSNVYVQGTPACDSGAGWGTFSWSFQTSPYEVNIAHARYQQTTDHCTAYYCFEVVAGTGTPDALESWYWDGDGYGGVPHWPCSNDGYTPAGQSACDEAVQPLAAIPPCAMDPIMLTPEEIDAEGCPCELQYHDLAVWNNTGADTNVDLTYTLIQGNGTCEGPAQVFVPNGTNVPITVELYPVGVPGDDVVCEVYAEDATTPANNDTSWIYKHLIGGGFDPAGWQLEPIAGATGNQWSGGAVGTNPAAAGPVGYIVGGLGVGSSVPNPDLQMYDPGTGTWTQLADMPNQRFSPVVGFIGGLLYAAGGYDPAFGATADLQVYDPVAGTWDNTTPAELPAIRGGGAGGVGVCSSGTGECLFHVGGGPDSSFANTTLDTYQYDPGTDTWTQLDNKPAGSSPDGHILGAGVGCLGHIYVGGDYRGFHEFFALDATQPAGSQWTQLANIPAAAGAMTPAFVCKEDWGAIVLIGGDPDGSWGTYNTTVYVYDIATDTWSGPLPQTLNVAQLGSVGWHMDDKVWTAGGTVGSGAISPMPFESLLQITCEPCPLEFDAWKEAPAEAMSGAVITYDITIVAPMLTPSMVMTDVLPAGVEYAGNLTYTAGYAWYDDVDNAVYWEYTTKAAGTPAPERPIVYDPASAVDLVGGVEPAAPAPMGTVATWAYPNAVLWDNGPLVTHPGACAGMDASRLQTDLAMNTLGFGHQLAVGNRMADDFEITDPDGWQIDQITFFAYQTNAPTNPSPITGVYYQIWDGPPNDPASSVVYGDLVTNRLLSSTFSDMQRDSGTSPCANNRYIFADVAEAGVFLPAGIYWFDWMTDGTLSSGPWAPPITILGQTTTGNALQYTTSSGAWGPANDSGTLTQQGMPFIIEGTIGGGGGEEVYISFDVTVTANCGETIVNEGVASDGTDVVVFSAETEVPCIGWLDGYVMDAEVDDVPCTDAVVHVEPGGWDLMVDPLTGYYWAEVPSNTYTLEASAPGYSVEMAVVDVTDGMTTSTDFGLWRPVIEVDPLEFEVTGYITTPVTYPLNITNDGHLPLDFEISELPSLTALEAEGSQFLTTWLAGAIEVEPKVLTELQDGPTDFYVKMRLQADLNPAYDIQDWSARGWYVYDSLKAVTAAQAPIIAYAESANLEYHSFLIDNQVLLRGATQSDLDAMLVRQDVYSIRGEHVYQIDENAMVPAEASIDAWGWNLDNLDPDGGDFGMQAAQVWQDMGIFGEGIVVANIDTGAYYQHEALVNQYRGTVEGDHNYNWFHPESPSGCDGSTNPCDNNGHGSGTIGIMAGEKPDLTEQIGVAPGATWIACKGCATSGCSEFALNTCADFMVAPWDLSGANPNPDKRPHVINNSWGGGTCDDWYDGKVAAWVAAGQFPAFSAGNTTACNALGSPGDTPQAFGTAAHSSAGGNLYAGGPSCYFPDASCDPHAHEVDPHLNAPTFGRTAGNSQGSYYNLSGTSGASPHTAGCVALLWSANPTLIGDWDGTFTILEQSSDRTRSDAGAAGACGKPTCAGSDYYPNYEYGWGYLDCYAGVEMAMQDMDIPWVWEDPITGTIPPTETAIIDVTFHCTATGDYTGTLQIMHNDPCAAPINIPLTLHCIECEAPAGADFAWAPLEPAVDGMVYFTGTVTTGTLPVYTWDLGDDTYDTGEFINHAYMEAGTYTVLMTVTNDCGEDYATHDLVVVVPCDEPAGVDFTWSPLEPLVDEMVYFTGTVATGTLPFYYTWDFGDTGTGSGMNVTHTFVATGTFTVTLTVTNTCGMDEIAYAIVVTTPQVETYEIYLPIIVRP